ncbi:hypothetical protein CGL51_00635 [Pyrobaculum aerophilum]|uniref:Uncharacterized protein n=1 Tax=Pyrobaculum aerophilum TaxID=13773 RepID=A0A371R473_9CREN|nr:hypothetical protein CGL51_00635 [Pyrobaculum aerophilum]RFA99271.1 hypothetical protein CGL52_04590 [Pyrobaculum aerophilum]
MKELPRHKIKQALEREDYKLLSQLCLELLQADNWLEGWRKMEDLVRASGEYVLAKFMASAYALSRDDIYNVLSAATREFLARDVVVCLEKTAQVIVALSQQEDFANRRGPPTV